MATVNWWDPEGTATETAADLTSNWNNNVWSTTSAQTATPGAFSSGVAVCFCAGSTSVTTPITVTNNSAVSIAGIFNGGLGNPDCNVVISGTGSLSLVNLGAGDGDAFYNGGSTTTIDVPLKGTGEIAFEDVGKTYFNATNTFSGGTSLGISGSPAFSGAILFNNGSAFGTGPIIMTSLGSGCQLAVEGTSAITLTNAVTAANIFLLVTGNTAGLTFSGPWNLAGGTPILGINSLVTISGPMSGAGGVIKYGSGTLALTGSNSFSSGIILSNGTLSVIADTNFGMATATPTLNISLDGGTLVASNSFALSPDRLISLNANSSISVASGQTLTYGGNITGPAALTKTGTGTLALSGANGYSGATTVSSGTLEADSQTGNSVGAGTLTISASGTLSGLGFVSAAVSGTGIIEPGTASGPATLSLNNGLNLSSGGTFVWNLSSNSTSSTFPVISLSSGNLALGGSSKLSVNFNGLASAPATNNPFWLTQEEWNIVSLNGSGANSGLTHFASLLNGNYAAGNFTNYSDALGNIDLVYLPNFSVFDTLYDSGASFTNGENLILTNFSGLSLYAWSSTNAALPVSDWVEVGQMSEQTLAPALPGYSRYEINAFPSVSPTFYVAGNMNTGPYFISPVPVCMVTTPDFLNFTVTTIDTSISSSGVLGLLPAPPVLLPVITYVSGQAEFQFSATTNLSYVIQSSTDLVTWTSFSSGTITNSPVTFIDPAATNASGFYRVLLLSPY